MKPEEVPAESRRTNRIFPLEIFLAACATVGLGILIFPSLSPTVFFGDDLSNYLAFKEGRFGTAGWGALTEIYAAKYRPVFSFVWGLAMPSNPTDFHWLLWLNFLIEGMIAAAVYGCLRLVPNIGALLALAVAVTAACSRFALYQVTQVTGLVESVALFFFIIALLLVAKSARRESQGAFFVGSWMMLTLSVFTHERYLAAVPWFGVAWFFLLHRWSCRMRLFLFLVPIILISTNIFAKKILGTSVLQGTGGATFSLIPGVMFFKNISQALLSLLGFNFGPDYLVGTSVFRRKFAGGWGVVAAVPVFLTLLAPFVLLAWRGHPKDGEMLRHKHWYLIFFVLGLAALMLIPPALTIRMEQRWLLVPHILIFISMLLAVSSISNVEKKRIAAASVFLNCCFWFLLFALLRPSLENVFFVESGRVATQIERDVSPIAMKTSPSTHLDFFLRPDHCEWTLLGGQFFLIYGPGARTVECLGAYDPKSFNGRAENSVVFFRDERGRFIRLDD